MPLPRIRALIANGYLQPWFLGYGLIGLVVSGIVPILIPLSAHPHGAVAVGLVVAAFYLGTLSAPVFGQFADRTGRHRLVFLASFPVIAVAAIAFGLSDQTWEMFSCMLVAGAAAGAAQTTASMFIVEGRPRNEWPDRTGWMRLAFGAGQVAGLAVAVYFTDHLDTGWIVVGVIMLAGPLLASRKLPHLSARTTSTTDSAKAGSPQPGASPTESPQTESPQTGLTTALGKLRAALASRFGVFLGFWLFAMIGLMTFYNVVPLVLKAAFATSPATTSLYFLVGSAIGAVLYPVCGSLTDRIGSAYVLAVGAGVTTLAFLVLSIASLLHLKGSPIGGLCLVVIAAVYPLQYVGANLQAAELATGGEGAAMGLFNSGVAAGAVIGALAPAALAHLAGYAALPWFSLGAMVVAACFGIPLLLTRGRSTTATQSAPR